jgi:hypothetical protein
MSEAWTRIRAVRHLPVRPADLRDRKDARKKRPKKVRWGVVHTRVFESDDGDEQRMKKTYKWDIGKKEKWLGREVWNGVEREDEHEIWGAPPPGHWEGREVWGAAEGSDGQMGWLPQGWDVPGHTAADDGDAGDAGE